MHFVHALWWIERSAASAVNDFDQAAAFTEDKRGAWDKKTGMPETIPAYRAACRCLTYSQFMLLRSQDRSS